MAQGSDTHPCDFLRAKEKRLMEEGLRKVKTLGSTDPDADDISSWVTKSRENEAETKRADERAAAAKLSSMYDEEVPSQKGSHHSSQG